MTPREAPLDRFIFDTLLPWWQAGRPLPNVRGWRDWPPESLGIVGFCLFMALVYWCMQATGGQLRKPERAKPERKHRDTPTFERLLAWLYPPPEPCAFGHVVCSFKYLVHMIVFGAPGSGKSTFMYNRIIEPVVGVWAVVHFLTWGLLPHRKRRGKLVITGNLSKPFRAAILWLVEHGWPGYIWTPNPNPGEGFGLDLTEGPPPNVAERFIAVQPVGQGNTGLRSGAVEGMLIDACYELQHRKIERTFNTVLALLPAVGKRPLGSDGKPDFSQPAQPLTPNEKAGLEDWSTRIRTITRRLGASVGHDVRLSDVLRRGEAILVEGSSYNNPNSIEPLMQWMVYTCMWLVGEIGNFDIIIDEPGAVGPGTFVRLLTATRAAGVRILIGMQSRKQVDDTLREMCPTVLLCGAAAGAPEAREFESRCTDGDVPPEDFVLLEPKRWYEWLLPFWPRRGLYALEAYLFSNGRLDKVRTAPCDLRILDRWPSGSIPCIPGDFRLADEAEIAPVLAESSQNDVDTEQVDTEEAPRVCGPVEIPRLYVEAPVAEKLRPQLLNIWLHHIFPRGLDGCHESTYRKNNSGRPGCSLGGADWTTYILVRVLQDAIEQGMDEAELVAYMGKVKLLTAAGQLSVDHVEGCENEVCDQPDHLAWESVSRNSELYHERRKLEAVRGVGAVAD